MEPTPNQQSPIDPQKAFSAPLPPPPGQAAGGANPPTAPMPPQSPPPGWRPPTQSPAGYPPPMPFMYPPPPQPPAHRHSFVRGILVTLATTIFGFSLALNLYLLIFNGLLSGGGSAKTSTIISGDLTQRVAVVPLEGVITDDSVKKFNTLLQRVERDANIKALVVEIDTPGGSVTASDQMYNRLTKFRKEHPGMPVVSSMSALATSGGYYAACGTTYIVAQRTTLTGNIGVLMPRYNLSEATRKLGIQETTIASTGAPFKNAGSMFKPELPAETKYFQDLIDEAFGQFKAVVRDGRQGKLKKPLEQIADGRVYSAPTALTLGLIDQVGYLEDAIAYAAKTAGLARPTAVRYEQNPSLSELLLGAEGRFGAAQPGVTLHVSPEVIDQLSTPRLMYLWRGE